MANDYKRDDRKPPVLDAVLIPYRRAILAIAAMKLDMAERHKLQGAKDPYQEWRNLPNAKQRLANAGARHALQPWEINTKDGTHLHIVHAITGLLMALEKHLEEQEQPVCTSGRPRTELEQAALDLYAYARWEVSGRAPEAQDAAPWERLRNALGLPAGTATRAGVAARTTVPADLAHVLHRARAEAETMYWTGDGHTWACTCGAGRAEACTCSRASGGFSE